MIDKLYEITFFISAFLYLFIAFFLFTHKKGNRLSHRLFSGFCLSKALLIIDDLANTFRSSVYSVFPVYLDIVLESAFFLIGPFLFFYTRSQTDKKFVFKKIHLVHLVPFVLDIGFRHYRLLSQSNVRELFLERGYFISRWELISRHILMDAQVIVYIIASLVILVRYRSRIKDFFSSIEQIKLSWLYFVLFGFMAAQLLSLTKHTLVLAGMYDFWLDIFGVGMHLGFLLFAIIVAYMGLRQPEIFSGFNEKTAAKKYAKTALSQEKMEKYLGMLIRYMETEKPYLNPDVNLKEIAIKSSIPAHHISQILSQALNQNFYYFVNKYRIEECKRILSEENDRKTILEALYEAGFNSKSTFNSSFKKITGMTPTQFINSRKKD